MTSDEGRTLVYPPYIVNEDSTYPAGIFSLLCQFCQNFVNEWSPAKTKNVQQFEHHGDISELLGSAKQGCQLCDQLIVGFVGSSPISYKSSLVVESGFPIGRPGQRVLNLYTRGDTRDSRSRYYAEEEEQLVFDLRMVPGPRAVLNFDPCQAHHSTLDAMPHCKKWFHHCLQNHERCRSTSSKMMPTRLVAIGGIHPRLCEGRDIPKLMGYATLSHCWGGKVFMTLQQSNLQSLRRHIPVECLPKTFRDAIYIARYLGFQYLWIDSLCIVQDDDKDWQQESASMADVYGGADLNIAASSAEDGSVGCFFRRQPSWRNQLRVKSNGRDTFYTFFPKSLLFPDNIPLHRRSWVVQERYLSQRILHFFENQVYWDCDEGTSCEALPDEVLPDLGDYTSDMTKVGLSAFTNGGRLLTHAMWPEIVSHYSRANLTVSSDKLVAIGSLAMIVQGHTNDEYIIGLWRANIESQLLWYVLGGKRVEPYRAPSWSWASIDGHIILPEQEDAKAVLCVHVHNIRVEYASSNRFGQVKGGNLRIRCDYLSLCSLRQAQDISDRPSDSKVNKDRNVKISVGFDIQDSGADERLYEVSSVEPEDESSVHENEQSTARCIYILPVLINSWGSWRGLVLEDTRGERGSYRRIGTYWFHDNSDREARRFARLVSELQVDDSAFAEIWTDGNSQVDRFIDLV